MKLSPFRMEIVSWEKDQMGIDGKNLLDGVVLESAGTSAGDWLAFTVSRMEQPDNQNGYLSATAGTDRNTV